MNIVIAILIFCFVWTTLKDVAEVLDKKFPTPEDDE